MAARMSLEGYAYAAFRIVTGLLFLFHGLQKLFGLYGGQVVPMGSLFWVAGVIELAGGLLVMVGLFTTAAALVASGEMAAAYFMAHAPKGVWPIVNQGELAVLYCFAFLFIATRGAGMLSADRVFRRKS
ncbi:MAG: DoxX family protein [Acidobacteria bacterium]|nr:DoxX family protein [Acidobacteriota bacterium]